MFGASPVSCLGVHKNLRANPVALSSSPGHPLHCCWVTFQLGSVHVSHVLYSYGSAMMAPQDKTRNPSAWHVCPYQPAQPHRLTFSFHVSCSRTVELLEVACVPYVSYLSHWFPAILVTCQFLLQALARGCLFCVAFPVSSGKVEEPFLGLICMTPLSSLPRLISCCFPRVDQRSAI